MSSHYGVRWEWSALPSLNTLFSIVPIQSFSLLYAQNLGFSNGGELGVSGSAN